MRGNNIYNTNKNYFEDINSQNKAYVLGFIAVDGCNHGNRVGVNIKKEDVEVLDFIRKEISPDSILTPYQNNYQLSLNSVKLCRDLEKYNITRKKSLSLNFPTTVPSVYTSHFIRGYFDGDGSVGIRNYKDGRKKKGIIIRIAGTYEFLNSINMILSSKTKITYKILKKHSKSDIYYLVIQGANQVKEFSKYIYENSSFHLDRKFQIFKNYYNLN